MSQAKIYTLPEIQRINDARTAIPGHRYTDNFGNVWVGTNYRRLQVLSGTTAVWGNISGTLSDQSDLWLVLQSKQDLLVSGVNIKTINGNTLLGSGNISIVGGVQSVTGLNTDNTDPLNPVVEISVDGITITGDGTPGNPLVSVGGGGSVSSVTDDGNGVVTVDNTNPSTPIIQFNGVNVDGTTITGDGTSGNPLVANDAILKGTASGTDTYTSTITGVTSYVDGDAYLIRFTNGNTTVSTLNINSLGAIPLFRNNDGQLIGGDISNGAEMLCVYNSTANNFQVIGTAPNTLLAYVTNDDSVTITKGMPVYAFSGTGDRMTVKRAYNTTDATSAQTVGLVLSTSIAANQKGLIMMQGLLDGLSILPTSTYADGDAIYLGATAGTITNVKPSAPNHLVYLGVVTTANNGSAGRMYVRVQNGYEIQELHNVKITNPVGNNEGIFYNTSNSLWENKTIAAALGFTPISSVTGTIGITIDGGGSAITTGVKGYIVVPNSRTITGWYVVGAPSGSIVVDVWKANGSIPTVANTITGTEKPTLSSSQYNSDLSLSTWTTALVANDVIVFNVDSATTITKATIVIVTTAP